MTMLAPAILYKADIEDRLRMRYYSDEYFYFVSGLGATVPEIVSIDEEGKEYQWAYLDEDCHVKGYLSYSIDWNVRMMHNIAVYRFEANKFSFMKETGNHILMAIRKWKLHRVECCCVEGNKAKKLYDRFFETYIGGSINVLFKRDVLKDRDGNYHGIYIYESILEDGYGGTINYFK